MSKVRVAPLKDIGPQLTLPQLELMAAVIGTRRLVIHDLNRQRLQISWELSVDHHVVRQSNPFVLALEE